MPQHKVHLWFCVVYPFKYGLLLTKLTLSLKTIIVDSSFCALRGLVH